MAHLILHLEILILIMPQLVKGPEKWILVPQKYWAREEKIWQWSNRLIFTETLPKSRAVGGNTLHQHSDEIINPPVILTAVKPLCAKAPVTRREGKRAGSTWSTTRRANSLLAQSTAFICLQLPENRRVPRTYPRHCAHRCWWTRGYHHGISWGPLCTLYGFPQGSSDTQDHSQPSTPAKGQRPKISHSPRGGGGVSRRWKGRWHRNSFKSLNQNHVIWGVMPLQGHTPELCKQVRYSMLTEARSKHSMSEHFPLLFGFWDTSGGVQGLLIDLCSWIMPGELTGP